MGIKWGNIEFEEPYLLTGWDPPYRATIYAIMMNLAPKSEPKTYYILYFGESLLNVKRDCPRPL